MAQAILGNPKLKFIKGMFYMAPPPPEQKYLTFEALEDGLQIKLSINACQYSLNGKDWVDLVKATNTPSINTGERIYFKGNLTPAKYAGIGTFTISKKCNILGNCNSMLFGDDAISNFDLTGKDHAFYRLFYNCINIVDASQLTLPATALVDRCYSDMFSYCTSLVTAPELPATTLATYCYYNTFEGCSSLVTAPSLPATTLATYCYENMFYNCTSLVTAPTLPATTLAENCYENMFWNCSSLVTAPELPATTLANDCYRSMFKSCSSLVSAPALPATTLAKGCYRNMFYNCTSLATSPELPATTLATFCYYYMFYNCSKLNYIKALFTTTPSSSYTSDWVSGVSSTGTFVKNKNATWDVTGTSGIPTGWTVQTA